MSSITPENIDGQYPVPGQDNDSQGFRDNFTNIKVNFQKAKDEIIQLQQRAVLKSALPGSTLDNNMNGQLLRNARLQQISAVAVTDLPLSGAITLDYDTGSYFVIGTPINPTAGSISIDIIGSFPIGACTIRLTITVGSTSHIVSFPNNVSIGTAAIQGLSNNILRVAKPGTYEFEFVTVDQGTNFSIVDLTRNPDPINLPSREDLINSNNDLVSLSTTSTHFATAGLSAIAALPPGTEGQVKVLVFAEENESQTVLVANPGWGGAGTILLTETGQACTLMYTNSKWYCIGNNGCTFA